ncbi:ABC-2 type transport system ATP-binding protein [Tessaracoccus bendigoensis DSM 12906]|uniref:ABC-2 type transport system ATP-binding protein n=1 Tax=Tessaracoccus bendigoensis DSM 12906 TaxID=1123357 RepID=A0A1M6D195_9ACTN|nr:ABC transporter ATP-binding protein [Tessaracoccus bendigoensis]SHI66979.1 ABC-2 type transport system ATP-binding protein [Tessaracoccus bendigoensis DSM 12906]
MSAISIRGLTKDYGKFRAINGLDLELPPGQIVGLLGENGCGKTTLLKVLAGALTQYGGEVSIHGHRPGPESKAIVSFLPDASFLPDSATIDFCIRMYDDFFADFSREHASDLIGFFGLDPSRKLSTLSKGMREKAQIALAMSRRAKVYLLDEPISGVDPAARDILLQAIIRDLPPEALVLISTHLIHDLEPILDGVAFMRYGQVLLTGDVDDLRTQHGVSIDALFRKVYR